MGNLNCVSVHKGDTVKDWIRRETKVGKKKRHIDAIVADVLNVERGQGRKDDKKIKQEKQKHEDYISSKSRISTSGYTPAIHTVVPDKTNTQHAKPNFLATGEDNAVGENSDDEPPHEAASNTEENIAKEDNDILDEIEKDIQETLAQLHSLDDARNKCEKASVNGGLIPRVKSIPIKTFEVDEEPVESYAKPCFDSISDISTEYLSKVNWFTSNTLKGMVKKGTKPQNKAIERLKKDPTSSLGDIKHIPHEEKHGTLAELKWSRHMRSENNTPTGTKRQHGMIRQERDIHVKPNGVSSKSRYTGYVPGACCTIVVKMERITRTSVLASRVQHMHHQSNDRTTKQKTKFKHSTKHK